MSRRLIVMRHCKSAWGSGPNDHARPLEERGRTDAPKVAAKLVELGWTPDYALNSDALRAQQTWQHLRQGLDDDVTDEQSNALYLAGVDELKARAATVDDAVRTLLMIGHNPGWEAVVRALSGTDVSFGSGSAALLSGAGDTWAEALEGSWTAEHVIHPREL